MRCASGDGCYQSSGFMLFCWLGKLVDVVADLLILLFRNIHIIKGEYRCCMFVDNPDFVMDALVSCPGGT